jgi:enoyl-CoA hydratase/carnithine racemase
VTVARAIGRHRTLWMLLSARRVGAAQALDWGLVHAIEPAA